MTIRLTSDPQHGAAARRAVVLLSGGLDSATTLALARRAGYACYALSFRYGQRHQVELQRAAQIARALGAEEHRIVSIDLSQFGGSALTTDVPVPQSESLEQMPSGIPITYVPARNTVFLSFALAWAEVLEAADIFLGVNAVDYSGYPDCRPEYIAAYERMANLATKAAVSGRRLTIHTPLVDKRKSEIIQTGLRLGVDYAMTTSCYCPDTEGRACGHCDACLLRRRGFEELGLTDPASYSTPAGVPAPGSREDSDT